MLQLKINDEPQTTNPDIHSQSAANSLSQISKSCERLQPCETLRCKGCDAIISTICQKFCDICLEISTEIDEQLDSLNTQNTDSNYIQHPVLPLNPPSSPPDNVA